MSGKRSLSGQGAPDYKAFWFGGKETSLIIGKAAAEILFLALVFYGNAAAALFLTPVGLLRIRKGMGDSIARQCKILRTQFKDTLYALAAALETGYSPENAVREAKKEIAHYYGEDSFMAEELKDMGQKLDCGRSLEELWEDFAGRSGLAEAMSFAGVFSAAKKTGGNLIGIIKQTTAMIGSRCQLKEEIDSENAAIRLQSRLMNLIPLGILLFLQLSAPEFLGELYVTVWGRGVMSVCLAVYLAAYRAGEKIGEIEV